MSDQTLLNVNITESAQVYLRGLLDSHGDKDMSIRIYVSKPGTPKAETCLVYCRPGEDKEGDIVVELDGFKAYFEKRSVPFLDEAKVDYSADQMGGQLTIRSPNSKMHKLTDDSTLEDRINYVLYNEVNPDLAAHGGNVTLEEVTEDLYIVLKFGGGCQGCSAVDITLKQGVEKTLMERVPEIKGVRDLTDHTDKSNAYA